MANQIVVSSGAKVRDLNDVIIGTSGVLSSLAFNVANGVPKLDVNGKILVSQLPNSVMEYKGTWDASTNTPTLVNGTGNQGDVYLCNVAGTVNFGAGPIAFFVGDQVIYSGTIWQRASGATGTVTSVAVTETGDSLNITGSPITTSGTINIGFNGTNLQYINGAGDLTTFPSLTGYVTSVTGTAPVVSSGGTTPAISMAAATTSVNGYLTSADFTTFNNKQNAITLTTTGTSGASTLIGATLNIPNYGSALTGYVPYTGATGDVDLGAFKLNAQSLHAKGTAGNGHLGLKHQSASATASANEASLFADSLGDLSWLNGNLYLSKFITSGNTANRSYTFPNATGTLALLESTQTFTGTNTFSGSIIADGSVLLKNNVTSFLAGYVNLGGIVTGYGFSVGLPNGGTPLINQLIFNSSAAYNYTFPAATGTIALTSNLSSYVPYTGATGSVDLGSNSLSAKTFTANGNAGSSGSLHLKQNDTINVAGVNYGTIATNTLQQFVFYWENSSFAKRFNLDFSALSALGTAITFSLPNTSGTIALTSQLTSGTVTSVAALTLGTSGTDLSSTVANSTTTPVITLNVPTASATNRGALSSADFTTFNGKFTLPSLTSGSVLFSNGSTISQSNGNFFWDNTNNRLGIGTSSPVMTLDVNGQAYIRGWTTFNSTDVNGWYSTMQSSGTAFAYLGSTAQFAASGGTATDFGIRSQNAIAFYTNGGNERMRITSAGNVGIGISSPSYTFDTNKSVAGDFIGRFLNSSATGYGLYVQANDNTKAGIRIANASGATAIDLFGSGAATFSSSVTAASSGTGVPAFYAKADSGSNNGTYGFGNSSAYIIRGGSDYGAMIFDTGSAERMRITSGGNVNINGSGFSDVKFYVKGSDATSSNYAALFVNGSASNLFNIRNDGAVQVFGSLSKGSGSFRIDHPLESMTETHQLVHSFIEGPRVDLIYRGKLTLVNGKAQANIDEMATMTKGTFEALCREVQCFTTNESGWDLVKGKVIDNIIYIESQNINSTDEISWMVIGERKDKHIIDTDWTDDNGKVIVEPLKQIQNLQEQINILAK